MAAKKKMPFVKKDKIKGAKDVKQTKSLSKESKSSMGMIKKGFSKK